LRFLSEEFTVGNAVKVLIPEVYAYLHGGSLSEEVDNSIELDDCWNVSL
jgi:hypothetical protein